ncbi:hypothetical protein QBC47DRAFT_398509 [Echria macrotheca]|uniref:DRBM domain-containing protein n=1 Tax=Echria macrotheca TaxID=438768 RepID=A0AAJ0FG31_9PEZI|nr:hypothetical protein QBC47DRAFT_398509 [Echria macrotheca]
MAYKTSSSKSWQDKLRDACVEYQIGEPVFQLASDRRGGRTAWSSTVKVWGQEFSARFWYDGKNTNNAREDAAEVALTWLVQTHSPTSPSTSRRGW